MDTTERARAFYEAHKNKIGKDYRLEVLKLSKEDMYDFLDVISCDNVWGWKGIIHKKETQLSEAQARVEKLKTALRYALVIIESHGLETHFHLPTIHKALRNDE